MKQYHKNPRIISDDDLADLRRWLEELGDLSGIVHDLNSDEIIGGNQRGRVFDINQCEIVLVDGPHEPDEQGTVAHGFVVWQGKRYAYRQVRWTARQCEKANIVANQAGGDWDAVILAAEFEAADLVEWGFEKGELEELLRAACGGPGRRAGLPAGRARGHSRHVLRGAQRQARRSALLPRDG